MVPHLNAINTNRLIGMCAIHWNVKSGVAMTLSRLLWRWSQEWVHRKIEIEGRRAEKDYLEKRQRHNQTTRQTEEMDNAKQHWPILRELGTDLENKVREFLVVGAKEEGLIVATEDGMGYWIGKIKFGTSESTVTNPTPLDVPGLVSMAQNGSHILLLNERGEIYSMGENYDGQLGQGNRDTPDNLFLPKLISSPHKFISVRCGNQHSLALTKDGKVWAWGGNFWGQIDAKSSGPFPSLNKISELDHHRVVAIECGGIHSLALTDQNEVYSWGCNNAGQLGSCGSSAQPPTRISIPTSSPVKSMAAGYDHTLLLTLDGEVYACGKNDRCQLGLPNLPNTPEFSFKLLKVASLPLISQIACHPGFTLSIAMSSDLQCFGWGLFKKSRLPSSQKLVTKYPTVGSSLQIYSFHGSTPHSITLPGKECSSKTDLTTQTETVPNQEPPKKNLDQMFNNPDSCPDIRFQVGDKAILTHRCVLQTFSDHFRRLFSSSTADLNSSLLTSQSDSIRSQNRAKPTELESDSTPHCHQVTITIPDHSYPTFYAYLRFLYGGTLDVKPEHQADLFSLSVAYQESKLQQLCHSNMRTTLSPATCCLYYPIIHLHSLPELEDFHHEMLEFISNNFREVVNSAAFQSMDDKLCKMLTTSMAELLGPNQNKSNKRPRTDSNTDNI